MFSEGREDVNNEKCAGRPSTSTTDENIDEVKKIIFANRRITVREFAEDVNVSIGSCHSILTNDLGMRRVTAKFVQQLFDCEQKQCRIDIAKELLDSVRYDPNLLQRVITGDESWVYGYDVETNLNHRNVRFRMSQDRKMRCLGSTDIPVSTLSPSKIFLLSPPSLSSRTLFPRTPLPSLSPSPHLSRLSSVPPTAFSYSHCRICSFDVQEHPIHLPPFPFQHPIYHLLHHIYIIHRPPSLPETRLLVLH
ncbi:hypothetical protein RI129_011685 [Pyrocoelia pectoralis]|uniref:Histone-lysine N-methyltransferase SETMAR n=1 Tax=Pyrocoelia pectoralis TaxID=417401 RepID=A0AAN7V262_9COLE